VERQNLVFAYFEAVMAAEVRVAKSEGKYSEGVSDLPASNIREQVRRCFHFPTLARRWSKAFFTALSSTRWRADAWRAR
jgi:hypothetical protein